MQAQIKNAGTVRQPARKANGAPRRLIALALASAALLVALCTGQASAALTYQKSIGTPGTEGGQFGPTPAGVAVNQSTGDIYVVDRGNNRIEEFASSGAFVRAWGMSVVKSGPGNIATPEEQLITIRATGGTFKVEFNGQTTAPIAFDATPGEVEAALNALSSISTGGGSVSVAGGPGDEEGTQPYEVTFDGGPLNDTDVPQMSLDTFGLGYAPGTSIACAAGPASATTRTIEWLRNGVPIAGAEAENYVLTAADEEALIQCKATAGNADGTTVRTSTLVVPASPVGGQPPRPGTPSIAGTMAVGETLTCSTGSWENGPTFAYRWLRNGTPIVGAEASTYELIAADEAKAIQCEVTGSNAGGDAVADSAFRIIQPESPATPLSPPSATASAQLPPTVASSVATTHRGGEVFEVCGAADTCQAGVAGGALGQFDRPRGIAIDNSPGGNGDVYVVDEANFRVQKFTATGSPLLEIGKEVDKTNSGNLCTVASSHICGPGVDSTTYEQGTFGGWDNVQYQLLSNPVWVGASGALYVMDTHGEYGGYPTGVGDNLMSRIEVFDSAGNFTSQVTLPRNVNSLGFQGSSSIAVNAAGRAFAGEVGGSPGILYFDPAEFRVAPGGPTWSERHMFDDGKLPEQLTVDMAHDLLWVVDLNYQFGVPKRVCGESGGVRRAIMVFDSEGHLFDCDAPESPTLFLPTGIATDEDEEILYVLESFGGQRSVRVFKTPERKQPTIVSQGTKDVKTTSATLSSDVLPGFEATHVTYEYGTSPCSSNPCEEAAAPTVYGLKQATSRLTITGLQPDTRYYFRTVTENSQGTVVGADRTFVTYSLIDLSNDPCSNALARKQTGAAALLDCRAYELASADYTGGYDVESDLVPGQEPLPGYPQADGKLLYSVHAGGIPGTGDPTNLGRDPYVATRGSDGWSTSYVGIPSTDPYASGPFGSPLLEADAGLSTFAFGGEELCEPCFADGSSNIPVRLPEGSLVQGMAGSLDAGPVNREGTVRKPVSGDGSHLVFASTAKLEPEANDSGTDLTLYERNLGAGTTQVVSLLPGGATMEAGDEVGELDVSRDGGRVLFGERLATDGDGNEYWHLYMYLASQGASVDLTPEAADGALVSGMTADGRSVFFTTKDRLLPSEDTDESSDLYRAAVGDSGEVSLELLSVTAGGPSNDDSCSPPGAPDSWNAASGDGKCGVVTFAGGGGVASGNGTVYFLSPEQLDGSKGEADQANLYVVQPGQAPRFVATMDSSVGKPGPIAPHWEFEGAFSGVHANPVGLAVDPTNGDFFIAEVESGTLRRYTSEGKAHKFAAGPGAGTNAISGFSWFLEAYAQIAVDGSSGPTRGDIYVTNPDEFTASEVEVFASNGEHLTTLKGTSDSIGHFALITGVSVDPAGTVYIGDLGGNIWEYDPAGASVAESDYTGGIQTSLFDTANVAAGSTHVYMRHPFGEQIERFAKSEFASAPPAAVGTTIATGTSGMALDPATETLYAGYPDHVKAFDEAGTELESFGPPDMSEANSFAFGAGKQLYVSRTKTEVTRFAYQEPAYVPLDNPAIAHGVRDSGSHHYGDFQVSADGRYAAFPSAEPLKSGWNNLGTMQVYRYATASDSLDCASCLPTEGDPKSDASLPQHGLGLTAGGEVFFNTRDQLVLQDTNETEDAYEWEGKPRLVSTGVSSTPSGLLSVSESGRDAFFFTRQQLVPADRNGNTMKIYDAREGGGYFIPAATQPCAASDECHGPGTVAAPPPAIGTFKGVGGQAKRRKAKRCRKGFVKRHRRCIRRKRHRRHHRKHPRGKRKHPGGKHPRRKAHNGRKVSR